MLMFCCLISHNFPNEVESFIVKDVNGHMYYYGYSSNNNFFFLLFYLLPEKQKDV